MIRRSHPEYSTATARPETRLSRCAFSEAGHSVTSGLSWFAATRHRASGAGSTAGVSGVYEREAPPPPQPESTATVAARVAWGLTWLRAPLPLVRSLAPKPPPRRSLRPTG